jgi:hypothetical protein
MAVGSLNSTYMGTLGKAEPTCLVPDVSSKFCSPLVEKRLNRYEN